MTYPASRFVLENGGSPQLASPSDTPLAPAPSTIDLLLAALAKEMHLTDRQLDMLFRKELLHNNLLMQSWQEMHLLIQETESFDIPTPATSVQYLAQSIAAIWRQTKQKMFEETARDRAFLLVELSRRKSMF